MKSLKHLLLFEANSKRPSGIGKIKDKSENVDVEFIAGDIYDLSDGNRYIDKFTYYKGEGNGYIMDKDGNYYDVITKSWTSDCGRIAGGSYNCQVIIKRANGKDDAIFNGYSGIMSSSYGMNIISDIENGYYLEDYIAKNWTYLNNEKNKNFEELKKKGNENAKSYNDEKKDSQEKKQQEFNERYIMLPKYVSFYIKDGKLEFSNLSPKSSTDGKPEKNVWEIYRNDFYSDEAYNSAKEMLKKEWDEYKSKLKEINDKLTDVVNKIASKLTEEFFKAPISKLSGLEFSIIPKNVSNEKAIAIDTKKNKVVTLDRKHKNGFNEYTPWKSIDENPEFSLGISAILRKDKASDYLKDLFKKISDAWQKSHSRTKTEYINTNWEGIWQSGRGYYPWNPDKYTKKEAKEIAERDFYKWLDKNNYDKNSSIEFFTSDIKNYISGNFVEKNKEENQQSETEKIEKTETSKFSGKLSEQEKKMDAWHAGTRKQNISSCSDAKLKVNYDICIKKGYNKEAAELKKEADARGLTLESLSLNNIKLSLNDYIELI